MLPPADVAVAVAVADVEGAGGPRGRRRLLPPIAAALGAAALGAAAAAAALLGLLRAPPAPQGATAAHVLLSPGSLVVVPSEPDWRYEEGIGGVFLSRDVQRVTQGLRVDTGGLYLLYGQFAVECTGEPCPTGKVTLQVLREGSSPPLLAVRLDLKPEMGSARSELVQAVGHLQAGDILRLKLDGDVTGDSWQLAQEDLEGNFVGMIRIATE